MKVEYLDHMGNDLSVVNAARISFNKFKSFNEEKAEVDIESPYNAIYMTIPELDEKDKRLLKYLAKHEHHTPFAHPHVSFYFKAPLFVARQLGKHQVGFVWSEVSRRYVTEEPEFYKPEKWRKAAENIKQGSSDEEIEDAVLFNSIFKQTVTETVDAYNDLLNKFKLCPEQARMFLPQNMYTEWHWTGSLLGWSRVCKLRMAPDAQKETRDLVLTVDELCGKLFPYAWEALKENW